MEAILTSTGRYLISQTWQIAAVFAIVAILNWFLRRRSAHVRYLLWLVVLIKCLIPPIVSVPVAVLSPTSPNLETLPTISHILPVSENVLPVSPMMENLPAKPVSISPVQETGSSSPAAFVLPHLTPQQWLAILWLVCTSLFLLFAIFRAIRTQMRFKRSRHPADSSTQNDVASLTRHLGLRRIPTVWQIAGLSQPFVWGFFRGSIYLPDDFSDTDTPEHRQGVLMHELAHIARFDALINVLQIFAQGLFFFHPLVWIANACIRREREKCCDEMAIAHLNSSPKTYSSAIVETLVRSSEQNDELPTLAVAGPVKNIEDRIKTILLPNKKFYAKPSRVAIITILLLAAMAVPTTLVLTARTQGNPTSDVEDRAQKHPAGQDSFATKTMHPDSMKQSTFEGKFQINKRIIVSAGPPTDAMVTPHIEHLEFKKSDNNLKATASIIYPFDPGDRWRLGIDLLDEDNKVIAYANDIGGYVPADEEHQNEVNRPGRSQLLWRLPEVPFDFGSCDDALGAVKFKITIDRMPKQVLISQQDKLIISEGRFRIGWEIPLSLKATTPKTPAEVQIPVIAFKKVRGEVIAYVWFSIVYARTTIAPWKFKIELLDDKNNVMSRSGGEVGGGSTVAEHPNSKTQKTTSLRTFNQGQYDAVANAVKFRIIIDQSDTTPGRKKDSVSQPVTQPTTLSPLTEVGSIGKDPSMLPFSVYGQVVDEQGKPIQGATVRISTGQGTLTGGSKTATDANGRYELRFGPGVMSDDSRKVIFQAAVLHVDKKGFYEANLCKQGNLAMSDEMPEKTDKSLQYVQGVVLPDQPYQVNFVMQPAARLTGELVDENGRPIADKKFSIVGKDLYPATNVLGDITTDANGKFVVEGVPCYSYWFDMWLGNRNSIKTSPVDFSIPGEYFVQLEFKSSSLLKPTLTVKSFKAINPLALPTSQSTVLPKQEQMPENQQLSDELKPSSPEAMEILRKVQAKYLSLKSYSDTGETTSTVEMILPSKEGSRSQFTGTFTTRLGRPNYYRIEYQQKVSDYQTERVNVWSAGKGDFLWMTGMETPKQENDRDKVLAMAGPNSSGVAGNLIKLFFNISTNLVDTFQQVQIEKDEQIEGDECYVLAGRHTGGGTQTLWISKKTFFIRKVKNVSEPSNQSPSFEDMARQSLKKNNQEVTPEAIHQFISRMVGDILKARNEEPTVEAIEHEIKKMEAINKTAMEMLKNQRFSTVIIYRNIQMDTPIAPNQFQPDSLDAGLNKPAVSQPAAGSAKYTAVVTGIVESTTRQPNHWREQLCEQWTRITPENCNKTLVLSQNSL